MKKILFISLLLVLSFVPSTYAAQEIEYERVNVPLVLMGETLHLDDML